MDLCYALHPMAPADADEVDFLVLSWVATGVTEARLLSEPFRSLDANRKRAAVERLLAASPGRSTHVARCVGRGLPDLRRPAQGRHAGPGMSQPELGDSWGCGSRP